MPNSSTNSNNDQKLLNDLPKAHFWDAIEICQLDGFWLNPGLVHPALEFGSHFQARNDDVLLASSMKTGTTWLKSLSLYITRRHVPQQNDDVLSTQNPHFHVPTIESLIYAAKAPEFDAYDSSKPRLIHTHLPYRFLPDSIKYSGCKIIYIARNPKDTLISTWHFFTSIFLPDQDPFPLQKAVDCFCSGIHQFGPYFDHVLEYWLESQKMPEKTLFLKYEELKSEPRKEVSRIAEFLGNPFEKEEEIDGILWKCSLERLKNLEVNKSGFIFSRVPNSCFFRKGEVGDWKNYLTPEMEDQIDQMSRTKLEPFGLFL